MDLVRDLLDMKVVDRNGRAMGRVDSVVLEIGPGGRPRVAAIEIGPSVLARRVHPVLGRWVAAFEYGLALHEGRPLRIPFDAVLDVGDAIKVDRVFGETSASNLERRLRRWIASIPGA